MSLLLTTLAVALAFEPGVSQIAYQIDDEGPRIGYPTAENPQWDCGIAGGQIAINRCYRERNQAAEVELEAAWDAFVRYFIPIDEEVEPPIVEEQQEAQLAFITYRDIHCETRSYSQMGGSATDMVLFKCLAELNEMRSDQLIELIKIL